MDKTKIMTVIMRSMRAQVSSAIQMLYGGLIMDKTKGVDTIALAWHRSS